MIRITLLFILGFFLTAAEAQTTKTITDVEQLWFGYFNQARFTDKFGIWTDLHLRTKENFTKDLSQSIARFGLTYYINDVTKATAGYAYVNHFPAEGHKDISQPEHRSWQQLQWHTKYPHTRMMQWIRLEQRYRRKISNDSTLAEGYNFNHRVRYNIFYEIPLTRKGTGAHALSAVVNDEVHINLGKRIVYNYFDQNRFFVGLKFNTSAHDNLQFGYMNLFQQLAAGNQFRNMHAFRLFYFQNLDLRRKKPVG
jgi:hypothetical protein